MSLVVTCPSCGTVFTMVREQLEASDGHVRCGHCMEVFDAQVQLSQLSNLDAEHMLNDVPSQLSSSLQIETPLADLSFVQQAKQEQFWSSPFMRAVLIMMTGLLISLLTLQLARNERERLSQWNPSLTPALQKLCDMLPCALQERRLVEGWLIESSSFQKEGGDNFRLTVTLKNTSPTSLLIPQLELTLLDNNDALLVRHVITPEADASTALPSAMERTYNWLITPQSNTSIRLNFKDIVGYRLALFYL
jgi:predicted Zn finger-like uncharacterized protein